MIRGRGYEPQVALLDGELLRTLPRQPMIAAALDALSHALESLWARRATRFTGALALAAAAGDPRVRCPAPSSGDVDAMQELIEASAMANLACGNSGLGLVHALSSAPDVHLAHGYQNGVLLPHVAAFNRDVRRAGRGRRDRRARRALRDDRVRRVVRAGRAERRRTPS